MAYELCLANAGKQVPSGPDWIHEAKLLARRPDGITMSPFEWAISREACMRRK